jgi:hypothetical protein
LSPRRWGLVLARLLHFCPPAEERSSLQHIQLHSVQHHSIH